MSTGQDSLDFLNKNLELHSLPSTEVGEDEDIEDELSLATCLEYF